MTAITKEKIAELRAVSYAATPTPWRVQTDAIGGIHKGTVNIEECGRAIETVATYCGAYEGHGKSNADFIVAAVNALPELLDEIESLRANNAQAWAECERQRFLAEGAKSYQDAVARLLEKNGCDCECDHHQDEHGDDCERCLACRISAAMDGKP